MERDLDEVIDGSLAERVDGLGPVRPSPGALAATIARVRRRRRRRAARDALASVGVAAVLVVGLMVGTHDRTPEPALTPTPTLRPTPTSTATPSATSSPTPPPATPDPAPSAPSQAQLDAGLGLPPTTPTPEDVWDHVGAGWALGIYRPQWAGDDAASSGPVRSTLVLADPSGTAHRLRELPIDQEVRLLRWEPGAGRALVTIAPVHDGVTRQAVRGWLDVRTGELTSAPGAVGKVVGGERPEPFFRGQDHRGDEIWFATYGETGGGGGATLVVQHPDGTLVRRITLDGALVQLGSSLLDPSGRRLVLPGLDDPDSEYEVVDLDTGHRTTHRYDVRGRYCAVVGWTSAARILTRCTDQPWSASGFGGHLRSPGDGLVELRLDGGAPRTVATLADGDPAVPMWQGVDVGPGLLVVGAAPVGSEDDGTCVSGLQALDGGTATALDIDHVFSARPVGTRGSTIYAVTDASCDAGEGRSGRLESLDGASRTLILPAPATTSDRLEGGLDSWVVAGGPSGTA